MISVQSDRDFLKSLTLYGLITGEGLKVQDTGAEDTSLLSSDAAYTASHAMSLHGKGTRDMQGTNGYQNGFEEPGTQQSLMSGVSSTACESGAAQEVSYFYLCYLIWKCLFHNW